MFEDVDRQFVVIDGRGEITLSSFAKVGVEIIERIIPLYILHGSEAVPRKREDANREDCALEPKHPKSLHQARGAARLQLFQYLLFGAGGVSEREISAVGEEFQVGLRHMIAARVEKIEKGAQLPGRPSRSEQPREQRDHRG